MGLFDIFSSSQGTSAANKGYKAVTGGINAATGALQNYSGQANNALATGANNASDQLSQGFAPASNYYNMAQQLYAGLQGGDQNARDMYLNSLGLNGASGNQAATSAFQASPGYQYQVDEANKNVLRNSAATGNVLSGNTGIALSDRAQQLANQDYGNWQAQLSGLNQNLYNDIGGQATQYGNLANLQTGTAAAKADIAGNLGTSQANNLMTLGQQIAQEKNAQGQAGYQNAQDIYGAQQSAGQNLWGPILGLAGGGLNAAGNAGGFGKLFS